METQKFKGDAVELKMEAAGKPAFDITGAALDEFLAGGYNSADFLLSLYDNGRMPFVDRVPRDSFVNFIKLALENFPVTGTFESYLFVLLSIFGSGSQVQFDVPAPGKLELIVNASTGLEFNFQAREYGAGYEYFDMVTFDGEFIQFRGISGIDSEAELTQLLRELIPAGIWPDITIAFFALYSLVADDGLGNEDLIVDYLGNQIVLFEV